MESTLIYRSKIIMDAYKGWIPVSSRVLDVGCGNGVVTEELRKHFCCSITGTDVLDYRKREIPFKMINKDNKLPFNDKEFDIAMFNDALAHCKDWEAMLEEGLRVAYRILIFEIEPTIVAKILGEILKYIHNPNMNTAFSLRSLEQWNAYFDFKKLDLEYRKIVTPCWYPFKHFAFKVK